MPRASLLIVLVLNAVWSLNPIASKILQKTWSPLAVGWLRYTAALLSVMVFLPKLEFARTLKKSWRLSSKHWWALVASGLLPFFLAPLLTQTGISLSSASQSAIVVALEPLWAVALAALFLKERLSIQQKLGIGLALVGVYIMGYSKESVLVPTPTAPSASAQGLLFLVAAQAAEAAYSVGMKPLVRVLPAGTLFTLALSLGWFALSATVLIIEPGVLMQVLNVQNWEIANLLAVVWLGVLGGSLGYFVWIRLLQELPVSALALSLYLQPVLGAFSGQWFLGERLSFFQTVGGMLLLFAVWIASRNPPTRT